MYEMATGLPPFYAEKEVETYTKIVSAKIDFTLLSNNELMDIIKSLCTIDQSKRLGRVKGGWELVKKHLYFSGFSWDLLCNKKMKAVYLPNCHELSKTTGFSGDAGSYDSPSKVCSC